MMMEGEEADSRGRFSRQAPGRSSASSSAAREVEGYERARSAAAAAPPLPEDSSPPESDVGATDAPGPSSPASPPRASAAEAAPRPAPHSPASAAPPLSVHTLRTPASSRPGPTRHDARSPVTQNFTQQQQSASLLPPHPHATPQGGWDSTRGGGGEGGRDREPQPFAASTPQAAAAARPAGLLLHETAPLVDAAPAAAASVVDWGGSLSPVGAATRLAASPVADDASDGGAGSVGDWGGAPEVAPAAAEAGTSAHNAVAWGTGGAPRTPSPDTCEEGPPLPRSPSSLDSLDLPPPPARPSLHGGPTPAAGAPALSPVVAEGSAGGARHSAADSITMGAPGTSAIRAFTAVAATGGPRAAGAFSAAPSAATRLQQQALPQRPVPPPPAPHDLTAAFDVPPTPAARWEGGEPSRTPPATRPPAPSVAWFIGEESRLGSAARPPQPPPASGGRGGGGGAQALHRLLEGSGVTAAPLPPSSPGEGMRLPRHPPVEFFSPPPHTQAEPPAAALRWFVHPTSSSVDITAAGAAGCVTVVNRADTPLALRLGLPASGGIRPLLALRRGQAATVPPHTEASVELLLALPDLLARDAQAAATPAAAAAWSVAAPQSGEGGEEAAAWEWSAARRSLLGFAILVSADAGRGGPLAASDACAVRVAIHEGAWHARGWRFDPALQALVPAAAPARAAPAPPVEGPAAASRVPHKTPARALPETPWPPSSPPHPQPSDDASVLDASLRGGGAAAAALTIVGGSVAGEAASQQGQHQGGPPGMYFSMRTIYFPPTAPGASSRVRIQLCNTSSVAMTAQVAVVPPGVRLAEGVPIGATRAELAAAAAFHVKRPHRTLELRPRSYCMLPVTFAPPALPAQRNGESVSSSAALLTPPTAAVLVVEAVPVGEGAAAGSGLKTSGRAMLVGELLQG